MFYTKNKNELEILDERLTKSQQFCNEMIEKQRILQKQLIQERNELFEEKRRLDLEKSYFELEKENIFKISNSKYEHLQAELDFIKEHRMLPLECKFYTRPPKIPARMKRLRKKIK